MKVEKKFMRYAILLAKNSAQKGDYALGAVIVKGNPKVELLEGFLREECLGLFDVGLENQENV